MSEIIDKLSPNIAPPTQAATIKASETPLLTAIPAAIGTIDAMVPMDVPVAVPIKAEIIKIPTTKYSTGTRLIPRFTTESRPPIAATTIENAPAKI